MFPLVCLFFEELVYLLKWFWNFFYLDGWFNACTAVERAMQVFKGTKFDKKKSIYFARGIILILPFCIISTLIHELMYRRLFVYPPETDKTTDDVIERYVSCITHYFLPKIIIQLFFLFILLFRLLRIFARLYLHYLWSCSITISITNWPNFQFKRRFKRSCY